MEKCSLKGRSRTPVYSQGPGPSFVVEVEQECDECGGRGYDLGSLGPTDAAECTSCQGSGRQTVKRDYLAEGLRIAAGNSSITPKREHLEAVVQHCRSLVYAAMAITELPSPQRFPS